MPYYRIFESYSRLFGAYYRPHGKLSKIRTMVFTKHVRYILRQFIYLYNYEIRHTGIQINI